MKRRTKKRLSSILAMCCVMSMLVSTMAFFTDREIRTATAKVGNLDLVFTDISASKTGTNQIISVNTFAQDKAWVNGIIEAGKIINPGDNFDLSYKMSNTGNKSMDVRQRLTVTSTVPMTDVEEFKLLITGEDYNNTVEVAGIMSDDGMSIVYDLDDIILNGTGARAETEDGVDWSEQTYTVELLFDLAAQNAFQGAGVSVALDAQAKQHRNTSDADWSAWNTYTSSFERVDDDTNITSTPQSITVSKLPTRTNYAAGDAFDPSGMEITVAFADGTVKTVTSGILVGSDGNSLTADQTEVTISYEANGVTQSTTVPISVMTAPAMLAAGNTWMSSAPSSVNKANITEVNIVDSYMPVATLADDSPSVVSWDASANNDGSVTAYVEGTKLTISGNGSGAIKANPNSANLFSEFTAVTEFNGLDTLDTSNVESLENAFKKCSSVTTLDLSTWDTSNVTNLQATFDRVVALETIDVSNWNTSKVTNMNTTFQCCLALTELDLSGWTTDNVTDMRCAFRGHSSMGEMNLRKIVGIENWNTSNVAYMNDLFSLCTSLTELDVSNWSVGNVTTMNNMFYGCNALETVGSTTNWDTANVTAMQSAFNGCTSLTKLDVSNWNVGNVTNMNSVFNGCTSLTKLDVSNWNVGNVTDMSSMFNGCTSLTELDVSNWNVGNVTNMNSMFSSGSSYGATQTSYTELAVSNWDTKNVTDMSYMFYAVNSIDSLDLSGWDVRKVANFDHMFSHSYMTVNGTGNWVTSAAINFNGMFHSVVNTTIDVSNFDTRNVQFFCQMFENCVRLTEIIGLENFDTSNGLAFDEMFNACSKLKELDLSSFDTTKAKDNLLTSTNGHMSASTGRMFNRMDSLEKITLGANFSFDGDGTTTSNVCVLPTPNSDNIPGATGNWYRLSDGTEFAPADVPNREAATYVAVMPAG